MPILEKDQVSDHIVESRVRTCIQTLRNAHSVGGFFGFEIVGSFDSYLSGKRVLDLGSGYNGLAIDLKLRNIPAEVISVNPQITNPNFELNQQTALRKAQQFYDWDFPDVDLEDARKFSMLNTYSYFAHNLLIADHEFDVVIDGVAVFNYYEDLKEKQSFRKSVLEMRRVVKPRHPILICDPFAKYGQTIPNWKEEILAELGIKPMLIQNYSGFAIVS